MRNGTGKRPLRLALHARPERLRQALGRESKRKRVSDHRGQPGIGHDPSEGYARYSDATGRVGRMDERAGGRGSAPSVAFAG